MRAHGTSASDHVRERSSTHVRVHMRDAAPPRRVQTLSAIHSSLVPRPFFAGEEKNGLVYTVHACVNYSVKFQ